LRSHFRLLFAGSGLAVAAVLSTSTIASAQDIPSDVKPDHWAYEAVSDLAKNGLIKGYPPDGKFLGGRTLTRYEMATIIKRILDRMDDIVKQQKPGNGITQEDFDKLKASVGAIQQLVSEFKTQLTVIGTDMSKVKDDLTTLKQQVGDLSARADAYDRRLSVLSAKVDETTLIADQAIRGIEELRNTLNAGLARKVDVGVGKLRVGGLFQVWYGTAFGNSLGGNTPSNFSPVPQGRNFGGGVGDTFRLRRAQIILDGRINDAVNYYAMLDLARTGTGTNAPLQDLWIGLRVNRYLRLEVGQQKVGLSEEGTRDNAQLLTIARSIMNEDLPANAGRIGSIRDEGAVLKLQTSRLKASVGIWNDNGATTNSVDNNRLKFLSGTVYYSTLRHFTFGIWGGTNIGDFRPRERRDRAGGTFLFQGGPHTFEIEGAYARDIAPGADPAKAGSIAVGWYGLYAYRISRKWQVVIRYDVWDPAQHDNGASVTESGVTIPQSDHKLKEYTFGINYNISPSGSKIQLNYIRDDVEVNGGNFFGVPRSVLLANFQTAF
jgi:hypothetical protein